MEVRWSLPAAEDLEHICEWIERDNPEAASQGVSFFKQA
jgi:plasmid stabilization system protein ParE